MNKVFGKWHGRAGQCWKLFSECTSGPSKGYKTYCVLPKDHVGPCTCVLPNIPDVAKLKLA